LAISDTGCKSPAAAELPKDAVRTVSLSFERQPNSPSTRTGPKP